MKQEYFNMAYTNDLLIFGIDNVESKDCRSLPEKRLSILLVKRNKEPFKDYYALPGGFVNLDESSLKSVSRILKKETGLDKVYMQQLRMYDDVNRDIRGRVITLAYISLVDRTLIKNKLNDYANWFDILIDEKNDNIEVTLYNEHEKIKYEVKRETIDVKIDEYNYKIKKSSNKLAFEHEEIIINGVMELRKKVTNTDIAFNLMPEYFTIGELKQVYELILGKKLINAAFRRIISDKIEVTDKMIKTGGHRPSNLCKYKK